MDSHYSSQTSHTFPTDSHLQGAGKDSRPTGASVPSEAAPIKLGLHHGVVLGGVDVLLDASCRCVRVVCRAMQCKRARPIFFFCGKLKESVGVLCHVLWRQPCGVRMTSLIFEQRRRRTARRWESQGYSGSAARRSNVRIRVCCCRCCCRCCCCCCCCWNARRRS